MTNKPKIVGSGAVISQFQKPWNGKWSPFVRFEGKQYGVALRNEFDNAKLAADYAEEYAKKYTADV